MVVRYVRLRPSQELLRFLKGQHFKEGARVSVIVNGKEFEASYEILTIK
jgi:hypothetical protein